VASPLDSEMKDYRYKVGESFTNGAVVAELDDARFRVAFLRAQEHRDFTAQVAKEQLELRKKDFASEMELRKAEYEAKIAQADYADATLNLSRCRFVAPFNGKIAELLTQRYETVKPGQPLFRIIEDDKLLAVANLPMGSVRVGEAVTVVPDGTSAVWGTVYEVAPQADNRTGTVRVRVLVENPENALTAGMTGVLKLAEATPAVADPEAPTQTAKEELLQIDPPGPRYATVPDAFSGVGALSNGVSRLPIEIIGLRFADGVLAYAVERTSQSVSIQSLKRVGELAAAVYDADGKRLALLNPQQVALPGVQGAVTNVLPFAEAVRVDTKDCKHPIKLVVRIEKDVRAIVLEDVEKEDGGR